MSRKAKPRKYRSEAFAAAHEAVEKGVTVAILDTGIRWEDRGLRSQVHLNTGELPYPLHDRSAALAPGVNCATYRANTYDASGDGVVNVDDYACDSRVSIEYQARSGVRGRPQRSALGPFFSPPGALSDGPRPHRRRTRAGG